MQFDFSGELEALRQTVRGFLEQACPVSGVRDRMAAPPGQAAGLWRAMGEMGFIGAAWPERYGGSGAGYLELCVIAEECGRVLAPVATVSSIYLAAELLLLAGTESQKLACLPPLAEGRGVGTLAVSGVPDGVRFTRGRLTGSIAPVPDGMEADFAIVLVRGPRARISLCLVDLNAGGVSRQPVRTIDPSRPQAAISFDNVPADLLGAPGAGRFLLDEVLDRAAVLTAFEQIGGADVALSMARDYALERFAFGRPIGSYQAVKHTLADTYVANELARSNAYYGAWALSAGSDRLKQAAATARLAATKAFQTASAENIQIQGGMGFTWESDAHLFYRRSAGLALILGSGSLWENRMIDAMCKPDGFGGS